MKKIFAVTLVAFAITLALLDLPAHAQTATGKIEGQITNGTKDAKPSSVQNLTVRLFGMGPGMSQPITTTTQSDANGKFSFSNLGADTATKYLLTVQAGGMDYSSSPLSFGANQTVVTATIQMYDTTTDASVLKVDQTHLIIDIQNRVLNVIQLVVLHNPSDRALVRAANNATLQIPIPRGAQNIQFEQPDADQTTLRGDGVLTYTLPFRPGDAQIVLSYALPFTPPNYEFSLKMPYDSLMARMLIADVGETVTSAQFVSSSPFQAQSGQKFLQSAAMNPRAGSTLNASFTNLPASVVSPTRAANQNDLFAAEFVLGISALACATLLIYAVARRRKNSI